ncbi:MAG: NTP transferase domain-containing protein [Candidatus Caldarchaeum sp.]
MDYITAVFANMGPSGRRGLLKINNRPMIEYVLDSVPDDSKTIFILSSRESIEDYRFLADEYSAELEEAVDERLDMRFQLEPVFNKAGAESVLVLPCDTPFINKDVTSFLRSIVTRFSAGIPRPVFDKPEFMPASYRVEPFLKAMKENPGMRISDLVRHVNNILYISAQSFRVFDDKLRFLTRVQNASDARKASQIMQALEG